MHSLSSPSRMASRLHRRVRNICIAVFFVGSLIPTYIPDNARNAGAASYVMNEQFLQVEEGFVMKTASITEQGHRFAYRRGSSHRVGSGESLNLIADLYGISVETIQWANDLGDANVIHPGQTLTILPVDGVIHTISRGQNLSKIAAIYDVSASTILSQNQLQDDRIFAGQQIIIPGGRPIVQADVPKVSAVAALPPAPRFEPEPPKPTPAPVATPPPSYGILQKPCDCIYTQYYHAGHYAVDLSQNGGGPIFAAEDGIVIRADYGWNGGYGNVIEVDHGNNFVTLYAHNRKLHVREGAAVRRGDVIATMGNTGRVYGMTGIHVHFETVVNGVKKNPLLYLQ